MATYATNTNPFIKPIIDGNEKCNKKDAPGMAKLQSSNIDSSQVEITSTLNDVNSDHKSKKDVSLRGEHFNNMKSSDGKSSQDQNKVDASTDEIDHIRSICDYLVETAVRRELNNSSEEDIVNLSERTSTLEIQSNDLNLDNEDEVEEYDPPPMEMDSRKQQHIELIKKLRLQLRDLERYAYERGELEQAPPSLIAERQSVILDTLKDKLSLNFCMDEIDKLDLNDLKKQVDREIHDLIDPINTKEHLLSQLKTQLTDLERYISHLHGTLDKRRCSCHLHGCSSKSSDIPDINGNHNPNFSTSSSLLNYDSLPKTSKLVRGLITQLICSDLKLQKSAQKESAMGNQSVYQNSKNNACVNQPQFHDGAAWSLHLDRVILATDSLVNLFTLEPQYLRSTDRPVDEALVESVVRRQLVPAIRDLLSYGLLDPNSTTRFSSYTSILFDPYYILSSLTCFPGSQKSDNLTEGSNMKDRIHVWNIIEDYYKSRSEPGFKNSSVKTLSQSFNLAPSMDGPIKITSKQALLIAVDDIIETLSKCKPDGPESHFRAFIYSALNRSKLATWLRLIFKNKSIVRKYYHNFSFVSQVDKMDKFLKTIEPLTQIVFNLCTDVESIEQFISAF